MVPFRIKSPGIYLDMPSADYFQDPAPSPSLTQSLAKVLIDRSPWHAWSQHPRLNPAFEPDDATRFDIGNVAHKLLLGRGKELEVIDADDWRTKAAKEARETARTQGRLGVLAPQYARAEEMAIAARSQLSSAGLLDLFEDGASEVVIAWNEGDLWMRSMIDRLSSDRRVLWDLKTTAASAAPHAVSARMVDTGWDVQGAMHERGLDVLDQENVGRRRHLFLCQEDQEPYALTVCELSESVLTLGRKRLAVAIDIWARCTRAGRWPGYPTEIVVPDYPEWAEARWLQREETEFSDMVTEFV